MTADVLSLQDARDALVDRKAELLWKRQRIQTNLLKKWPDLDEEIRDHYRKIVRIVLETP